MRDPISVRSFSTAIRGLPADRPVRNPRRWYRTQRQHWLGWLSEYCGPGFYGRQVRVKRDAKFAYNHIVEPEMLLYLARAAGVDKRLVTAASRAAAPRKTLMGKTGAMRIVIPWVTVAAALWPSYSSPESATRARKRRVPRGRSAGPYARARDARQ
jgi:hypothetical protein